MATRLYDTFTDTDGTDIISHSMDTGGGWTEHLANFTIQSNRARTSGSGECIATADAGVADAVMTCTVQLDNTGETMGLVGRLKDVDEFWELKWADGTQSIREHDGNVSNPVRASQSLSLSALTDYTFKGTFDGSSISFQIDSNTALSYSSSVLGTYTRFGLTGWLADAARYVRYDNFLVEDVSTTLLPRLSLMGVG
ncbi:MAG: hypothetical protein ACYCYF_07105 [Anaerolineae bacterium]